MNLIIVCSRCGFSLDVTRCLFANDNGAEVAAFIEPHACQSEETESGERQPA